MSKSKSHSALEICWDDVPKESEKFITHYQVRKRTPETSLIYENPITVNKKISSYTYDNLRYNTKYAFQVRACNDNVPSDWTKEECGKTCGKINIVKEKIFGKKELKGTKPAGGATCYHKDNDDNADNSDNTNEQ